MGIFERETRARDVGNGRFQLDAPPQWSVHGNINGGWLMAAAARAALTGMSHADPLVVSGHYLVPVRPGPLEMTCEQLNQSRSRSVASVQVSQQGVMTCHFVVAATDFDQMSGESYQTLIPPTPTPRAQCRQLKREYLSNLNSRVQVFFPPESEDAAASTGYECWLQHADEAVLQPLDLLMFTDIVPAAVSSMLGPVGWTPTLELSAQIRGKPSGTCLRARVHSRTLSNGLAEEDNELWDEEGRLVLLSRQLLKVRRSPDIA